MVLDILEYHAKKYPLMQPADAVKLLYQNEFGIGHLISDTAHFLERLQKEANNVVIVPDIELKEPVGNSLVRVMLNSPLSSSLNMDQLADACLKTANEHRGSKERFQLKLNELKTAARNGLFDFSVEELELYLIDYQKEGYPPVSHSLLYHDNYHPSYRVVLDKYM